MHLTDICIAEFVFYVANRHIIVKSTVSWHLIFILENQHIIQSLYDNIMHGRFIDICRQTVILIFQIPCLIRMWYRSESTHCMNVNEIAQYTLKSVVFPCIVRFVIGTYLFVISCLINTLWPRQNGRHSPFSKWIFLNGKVWISNKFSLKLVPRVPVKNIPALVQIIAWRRPGDKPLSGLMMVNLLTRICVTRPQWVK